MSAKTRMSSIQITKISKSSSGKLSNFYLWAIICLEFIGYIKYTMQPYFQRFKLIEDFDF